MWTDLSTRHLLALQAVAEEGTIGRAASRLGFTASAVSQQVAALEQIVGQPLFDRPAGPRAPTLTAAGEALLGHCEALLDQVTTAEMDLDRIARGIAGSLTVQTFQSISARVLPMVLGRMHREAPDVEVVMVAEETNNEAPLALLQRGELDLAFAVGKVDPALASRFLGVDPNVAVVPADFAEGPLDLSSISMHPLVGQSADDSCSKGVDMQLHKLGVTPRYIFRSQDNAAVQGMVAQGVGIAIVPLLTVDVSDPGVSVRSTVPDLVPRRLSIAWDPNRLLAPVAERFVELAVEVCQIELSRS